MTRLKTTKTAASEAVREQYGEIIQMRQKGLDSLESALWGLRQRGGSNYMVLWQRKSALEG